MGGAFYCAAGREQFGRIGNALEAGLESLRADEAPFRKHQQSESRGDSGVGPEPTGQERDSGQFRAIQVATWLSACSPLRQEFEERWD